MWLRRPFAGGQFADRRILTVVNLRLPIPGRRGRDPEDPAVSAATLRTRMRFSALGLLSLRGDIGMICNFIFGINSNVELRQDC